MNSIIEIFSSPSDQARLVTTLIAAFIAIIVVLVNQWFNTRRSKNEIMIIKIEEIYTTVIKLEELSSTIHHEIVTNYQKYQVQKSRGASAIFEAQEELDKVNKLDELNHEFYRTEAKAYMLSGLYFSVLNKNIKELKSRYQKLYISFMDSESLDEYFVSSMNERAEMEKILNSIYPILSAIMKSHMGLKNA